MTWNPVRFLETLIHFRVAGPLRSVLEQVPLFSQTMASPSLETVLTPTPLPDTVLTANLAATTRERLATTATALGYHIKAVEDFAGVAADAPAASPQTPLTNVPAVVWSPGEGPGDSQQSLAGLVSFLNRADTVTEATLADLRHPTPALQELWGALDDVVMGGVSSSQARWNDGLTFTGNVSTANSGGFASIRTRNVEPPINLAQWQGTVLHLKGDGQRYKWILRDSPGWDSLAYSRSFDTVADTPISVHTPFKDMVATFRARTKPDATPLNPAQICSMQLMLSKFEYDGDLNPSFQAGEFTLQVSRIAVYRTAHKPLVLLQQIDAGQLDRAQQLLGEANLMGVVPQTNGFKVIGPGDTLPGWIAHETVGRLCQGLVAPQ